MELIGKGRYSTAYKHNGLVYLKSSDNVKECMANGWYPNSNFFPKVERSTMPGFQYVMPLYQTTRAPKRDLIPAHYEIYKQLRELFSKNMYYHHNDGYEHWNRLFKTIKNRSVKSALKGALDALTNYGTDIAFEISPRNIAINKGKLILLDCFFLITDW